LVSLCVARGLPALAPRLAPQILVSIANGGCAASGIEIALQPTLMAATASLYRHARSMAALIAVAAW
jgi:hypothetical protein